jgi:rod shape-determining protein MreC
VVQVESSSSAAFARIVCQPLAGIDRNRQLLILLTESNMLPRPAPEESRDKKEKLVKRRIADGGREPPVKEPAPEAAKPEAKQPAGGAKPTPAAPAASEQKAPAP